MLQHLSTQAIEVLIEFFFGIFVLSSATTNALYFNDNFSYDTKLSMGCCVKILFPFTQIFQWDVVC